MSYYTRVFNANVGTTGLPQPLKDEFDLIAAAFAKFDAGTATAATAARGTNTTQVATTAYVMDGLSLKANLASPALTGIPTAPTAAANTNTTQLATCAFVVNQALTNSLPGQTGQAGKFVQTDGATASWQPIWPIVNVSSDVTLTPGAMHKITGGPWNLTLPPSPTSGMIVGLSNKSGIYTHPILRNGSNIEGVAADEVLDVPQAFFLEYTDSTTGWIIV